VAALDGGQISATPAKLSHQRPFAAIKMASFAITIGVIARVTETRLAFNRGGGGAILLISRNINPVNAPRQARRTFCAGRTALFEFQDSAVTEAAASKGNFRSNEEIRTSNARSRSIEEREFRKIALAFPSSPPPWLLLHADHVTRARRNCVHPVNPALSRNPRGVTCGERTICLRTCPAR